jgi:hypothetical protein
MHRFTHLFIHKHTYARDVHALIHSFTYTHTCPHFLWRHPLIIAYVCFRKLSRRNRQNNRFIDGYVESETYPVSHVRVSLLAPVHVAAASLDVEAQLTGLRCD